MRGSHAAPLVGLVFQPMDARDGEVAARSCRRAPRARADETQVARLRVLRVERLDGRPTPIRREGGDRRPVRWRDAPPRRVPRVQPLARRGAQAQAGRREGDAVPAAHAPRRVRARLPGLGRARRAPAPRRARGGARGQDRGARVARDGMGCHVRRARQLLALARGARPARLLLRRRASRVPPRLQDASARGGVPPVARTRGGGEARQTRRLPLEASHGVARVRALERVRTLLPRRAARRRAVGLAARLGRVPRVAAGVRLPRRAARLRGARCGCGGRCFPLPGG